jgi:hypothetical protein
MLHVNFTFMLSLTAESRPRNSRPITPIIYFAFARLSVVVVVFYKKPYAKRLRETELHSIGSIRNRRNFS